MLSVVKEMNEQMTTNEWVITFLLQVAASTASTVLHSLAVFLLLLFLLLHEHCHPPHFPLFSLPLSKPVSLTPLPLFFFFFVTLPSPSCIPFSVFFRSPSFTVYFLLSLIAIGYAKLSSLCIVLCPVEALAFTVFLDQDESDCAVPQISISV